MNVIIHSKILLSGKLEAFMHVEVQQENCVAQHNHAMLCCGTKLRRPRLQEGMSTFGHTLRNQVSEGCCVPYVML